MSDMCHFLLKVILDKKITRITLGLFFYPSTTKNYALRKENTT